MSTNSTFRLNCTFMELKDPCHNAHRLHSIRLNCTFMELKESCHYGLSYNR